MTHGNIVITSECSQEIALVISQVQVHFTAIVRHVDLSVPCLVSTPAFLGHSGHATTDSIGDMVPASMLI